MHLLDPAVPGQRLMHSAGPNSLRHGSKTKDSLFIRQGFRSPEHDMKVHVYFFQSSYSGPLIKIEKQEGEFNMIIISTVFKKIYVFTNLKNTVTFNGINHHYTCSCCS